VRAADIVLTADDLAEIDRIVPPGSASVIRSDKCISVESCANLTPRPNRGSDGIDGRGRKPRIARIPGEGAGALPGPWMLCRWRPPLTPTLSPRKRGRGSITRL
jgi:hypothetical protein